MPPGMLRQGDVRGVQLPDVHGEVLGGRGGPVALRPGGDGDPALLQPETGDVVDPVIEGAEAALADQVDGGVRLDGVPVEPGRGIILRAPDADGVLPGMLHFAPGGLGQLVRRNAADGGDDRGGQGLRGLGQGEALPDGGAAAIPGADGNLGGVIALVGQIVAAGGVCPQAVLVQGHGMGAAAGTAVLVMPKDFHGAGHAALHCRGGEGDGQGQGVAGDGHHGRIQHQHRDLLPLAGQQPQAVHLLLYGDGLRPRRQPVNRQLALAVGQGFLIPHAAAAVHQAYGFRIRGGDGHDDAAAVVQGGSVQGEGNVAAGVGRVSQRKADPGAVGVGPVLRMDDDAGFIGSGLGQVTIPGGEGPQAILAQGHVPAAGEVQIAVLLQHAAQIQGVLQAVLHGGAGEGHRLIRAAARCLRHGLGQGLTHRQSLGLGGGEPRAVHQLLHGYLLHARAAEGLGDGAHAVRKGVGGTGCAVHHQAHGFRVRGGDGHLDGSPLVDNVPIQGEGDIACVRRAQGHESNAVLRRIGFSVGAGVAVDGQGGLVDAQITADAGD